jgi:hypothetical protein
MGWSCIPVEDKRLRLHCFPEIGCENYHRPPVRLFELTVRKKQIKQTKKTLSCYKFSIEKIAREYPNPGRF